jgi:hypothetical protein
MRTGKTPTKTGAKGHKGHSVETKTKPATKRAATKTASRSLPVVPEKSAPKPPPKVAFPKKGQPPTPAEFAARLPAAVGKRFESVRAFLTKQAVTEDLYYYGPRTGWAYRYIEGERSLCSIMILHGRLVGIVALDAACQARVSWDGLSDIGRRARKGAHGTPALLWLDVPLDGLGATDFKALLKAKLARP